MRAAFGSVTEKMLDALRDVGPMTCIELCRYLGLQKEKAGAILSRLKSSGPQSPQRVHIKGYVYDAEGMRRYPRAVFAIGEGKHAKKPKANPKENRRRYDDRKKLRLNSVWMLGMSRKERRRMGIGR
jgi:hypothetical protein